MGLILRLVANFLAVLASLYVVNFLFNMEFNPANLQQFDLGSVLIFTVILILLNTFLKPILSLLALPLTCATFGLFSLVINAIIYGLAAYLVPKIGLPEPQFVSAIIGAVIVSIVSSLLGVFTNDKK